MDRAEPINLMDKQQCMLARAESPFCMSSLVRVESDIIKLLIGYLNRRPATVGHDHKLRCL